MRRAGGESWVVVRTSSSSTTWILRFDGRPTNSCTRANSRSRTRLNSTSPPPPPAHQAFRPKPTVPPRRQTTNPTKHATPPTENTTLFQVVNSMLEWSKPASMAWQFLFIAVARFVVAGTLDPNKLRTPSHVFIKNIILYKYCQTALFMKLAALRLKFLTTSSGQSLLLLTGSSATIPRHTPYDWQRSCRPLACAFG